ncbi:MAG TPA: hypothetical protein VKS79_02515, partial [Gemmataceae bacterium]|nr:hypothetical protein [Gemmataceae bacterium]
YIALAQAYLLLDRQLDALGWLTALPELVALRRTQIVTALEFAATLRPELDEPHLLLAQIYYGEGQLDRALDHLRARLQIAEQEAKKNSSDAKAGERERALQNDVKKLEADVHRAQQIYDANTKGQSDPSRVFARAQLAARHGLSQQALDLLKESDVSVFGKEGAQMELELLLSAGRAFNAFALLDPEQETLLGFQEYHILRARAAAACGNYAAAESALTRLDAGLDRVEIGPGLFMPVRSAIALHAADALLTLPPGHDAVHLTTGAFWRNYYLGVLPVLQLAERLRKRAELHVVRGLLALEPGDVETARREFHAALAIWKDQDAAAAGSGLDFFPRPIAQEMLRRIERTAAPTSNSK